MPRIRALMIRPLRLTIILSLLSMSWWAASVITVKTDDSLFLETSPIQLAEELKQDERWEDVLLLTQFSERYLTEHDESQRVALHKDATEYLHSTEFLAQRFLMGAVSGEPVDTASLLGSLSLDMFVVGDIRDLVVQGFREVSSGDGDQVVMALSATGLILTLAPELSWAPAMLKAFYRGGRISSPLKQQIETATRTALKTGNLVPVKSIVEDFSVVVKGMGAGPALSSMKHIRTTEELSLLARQAVRAPAESYTLTRIAGPGQLKLIRADGRIAKAVKIGARQQKLFGKLFLGLPLWLLVGVFSISMGLAVYLVSTGYLLRR